MNKNKKPKEITKDLNECRKKCINHANKSQKAWSSEGKNFSKKIKAWTKVLKKDWDSEPEDILIILKYKLERTRKQLVKNDLTMDTKRMEKEIITVEGLLDKVIKDDYLFKFLEPVKEKYGTIEMKFGLKETGIPNTISCDLVWPKAKSQKRASNAHRKASERAKTARKRDIEKAFALLAKNIWGWWD